MFSVVLTTHNEEKNLARCLNSIKSLADEIIVVDGESIDGTVKLAKELGAKVISTTNKSNFHINKQMSMDAAKGDIVLQLDADEVVDEELTAFIKKVLATSSEQVDKNAWWIRRKNFFMGRFFKKGGQYPDPVIRLYRKGRAKLPQKDVHEQMIVDGKVGLAEGHLLHYGNPTFSDYLRKFNTYTSFKSQKLYEEKIQITFINSFNFLFIKPIVTFLSLFVRHKGFVDGVPGCVFSIFSGLHHSVAYLKLWEMTQKK